MVVFTCNTCGETLQKPKVAKHYEYNCRSAPFLTCVDCFKDFRGEAYAAHTKCVTEAERYGGKDYVPKASANKGEKKQQEWINIVNNVINNSTDLSKPEKSFLSILSKYENIPRKKAKFLNFVRSAIGHRTNSSVVDSVWNRMEAAYKNSAHNTITKQPQDNNKVSEQRCDNSEANKVQESNIIENQNNENIDREIQGGDQQTKNNELNGTDQSINNVKKKKSKKRTLSETIPEERGNTVVKKQSEPITKVIEEPITKKKKKNYPKEESAPMENNKDSSVLELSISQYDDNTEQSSFDWKNVILEIIKNKGEISLKKLQKKVISQYMNSCSNIVKEEKATGKFNKKFKKLSEVIISNDKVKLA